MEYLPTMIIVMLLAAIFCLLAKLRFVYKDLDTLVKALRNKLHADTNTMITTASSDRTIRRLAAELNVELSTLRKQKLRLDNQNTELQNAVTNVAHDLRTPLTSISGHLELLEGEQLEGRASGYCRVIRERTEALKALTEELFQYSVLEHASFELKKEKVILNKELEVALAAAYQALNDAGIEPEIHIPEKPIARELDQKALQRIFGNILGNVVKYSSGKLTVTLNTNGSIRFSNPAPSLSGIEIGRLFDRYFTVENAKGSTGIGLSVAKLLTEKMGGSIDAEYRDNNFNIRLDFR